MIQVSIVSPGVQRAKPRMTNAADATVFDMISSVRSPTRMARSRLITAPPMIDAKITAQIMLAS